MGEFRKAIVIGAAPIGEERKRLLGILKWAGYLPPSSADLQAASVEGCAGKCSGCKHKCEVEKDVFVVAADGGISFLYANGVVPDLWIGDMDSLDMEEDALWEDYCREISCERVPVEKDDTDTALAVSRAYERGYREVLLFGCGGGKRLSHTIANVQLMCRYEKMGCHIRLMAENYQAEVLTDGRQDYSKFLRGNISVLCLSDSARQVKIKGLKYEYEGSLTNETALGVSNSFVGEDAFIEVEQGTLLLVYESEA